MTHIDNRTGPNRNYREKAVFTVKDLNSFGKGVLLYLHNFARLWLEHGFDLEMGVFLGPKKSKNPFFSGHQLKESANNNGWDHVMHIYI